MDVLGLLIGQEEGQASNGATFERRNARRLYARLGFRKN